MVVRHWEIKVQHMAQYNSSSHLPSHCTTALHQLPVRVIVTMSLWHSVVHSDINNVSITVTGSLCVDWWMMSESRSSDERIADTSVCQSAFLVSRILIRLTQKMDYHFWGGTSGNRMFTKKRVFSSIHPYPATSLTEVSAGKKQQMLFLSDYILKETTNMLCTKEKDYLKWST